MSSSFGYSNDRGLGGGGDVRGSEWEGRENGRKVVSEGDFSRWEASWGFREVEQFRVKGMRP